MIYLWEIMRTDTSIGYGECEAMLIRAANETDARRLASAYSVGQTDWRSVEPDNARNVWFMDTTTARKITGDGEPGVILASYTG